MREDGFLRLYCELQKIFTEDDLQELLIYQDNQQRFLVFHEKGMYVLENTTEKPFRYYSTRLLKPCSVHSSDGQFQLVIETIGCQQYKLIFDEQSKAYQVLTALMEILH